MVMYKAPECAGKVGGHILTFPLPQAPQLARALARQGFQASIHHAGMCMQWLVGPISRGRWAVREPTHPLVCMIGVTHTCPMSGSLSLGGVLPTPCANPLCKLQTDCFVLHACSSAPNSTIQAPFPGLTCVVPCWGQPLPASHEDQTGTQPRAAASAVASRSGEAALVSYILL